MHGRRKGTAGFRKPALVAMLAVAIAGVAVASAVAANVVGTAGKDTLRGSAKVDKMFGKAGNDKLFGLGGNDYLNGGPGNDLLVGGPGADVLVCGPGRDVAMADAKDKVGKDCEVVKGLAKPTLSIADASMQEGNAGSQPMAFTVKLSRAATSQVTVAYATANGSATAGSDYTAADGTLVFAPGETAKTVSVSVLGDTAIEADETFSLALSNAVNATIARANATGTIRNDDTAVPITAGNYQGLLDGNSIYFTVYSDRTIAGFRSNYIREDCNGGLYVYGTLNWGTTHFPIADDASFGWSADGTGTVGGAPATFHDEVHGSLNGSNASGTVLGSSEFDDQGTHYKCTSGQRPWTASLVP